jgi:hypothetical protein
MDAYHGAGIYVTSLFKLLALLGVTQAQVAELLHVPRPNVSLWASGGKALPRKHLEAFEAFVWKQLGDKTDAYWAAMEAITGNGPGYPLGDSAHEPLLFKPPPPDSPLIVQQWWDFHVRALALMDDWDVELHQVDHVARVEALIRQLGKLALAEGDKLRAMIEGSERHQLLECFTEGHTLLQALERIDARPIAQRLRTALHPRRPPATGTRARPRKTSAKAERR